jgi:hypothetical protein
MQMQSCSTCSSRSKPIYSCLSHDIGTFYPTVENKSNRLFLPFCLRARSCLLDYLGLIGLASSNISLHEALRPPKRPRAAGRIVYSHQLYLENFPSHDGDPCHVFRAQCQDGRVYRTAAKSPEYSSLFPDDCCQICHILELER